jgi:hypothetical protein
MPSGPNEREAQVGRTAIILGNPNQRMIQVGRTAIILGNPNQQIIQIGRSTLLLPPVAGNVQPCITIST